MLKLASEELSASIDRFDTNPTVINCRNGLVDLKDGTLAKHSPDQWVMRRADVNYSPDAHCPKWLSFIDEVFQGDKHLIDWMHRALGYSLTGSVDEQFFLLLYGRGENGKGKLCETILEILGDYAIPAQFDTFLATDKSNVRVLSAIGDLKGVRFALASETDSAKKWSEALMKRLTGGDTLVGARLYGQHFAFKPTHKLWFLANHLPSFKDATHGFKRRVRVVPFKAEFSGETRDKHLLDKLLAEREGIFAWLVKGAIEYFKRGLDDVPSACEEATRDYIEDNDTLGNFVSEYLVPADGAKVGVRETYTAYERWCQQNKETPVSINFFPRNMDERGIKRKKTDRGMMFVGYRLKADNDNSPSDLDSLDTKLGIRW